MLIAAAQMLSCNVMLNYLDFRWNGISPLRMATLDGKTEEINGKSSVSICLKETSFKGAL